MALAPLERQAVADESRSYMRSLVERARRAPGDDLIGTLVREHGEEVSDEELAGIGALLLSPVTRPRRTCWRWAPWSCLRTPRNSQPSVTILLRWAPPSRNCSVMRPSCRPPFRGSPPPTSRSAGLVIPGNSLVLLSLPSANHDPRFIDAPDTLDIRRGVPGHLAFGHGVHHCLGVPLARMEMRIAFPALLRRFPGLELAEDPTEISFKPTSLVYGARSLSVMW